MINIEPRHFKIVADILTKANIKFYVFGSRVKNLNKKFSDLDLCYKEPLSWKILVQIKTELEESNLPFRVDIVNYNDCSKDFAELIDKDLVEFTLPSN